MIIQDGAEEIGGRGYAHWSGVPVTPGIHKRLFVPQSIADGWECYCSCGEWRGFADFYEFNSMDALISALTVAHGEHENKDQSP